MLDANLIANIDSLELRARRIVEGAIVGRHQSPSHGFSIEFAQHRDYAPGDDPRYLDWKLHAKSDRYFLKQFEAETSLTAWLAIDGSESMTFQSEFAPWSKWEYATTLAAAAAYIIIQQRDSVGLSILDDHNERRLSPSGNPAHIRQVYRTLEQPLSPNTCDFAPALDRFTNQRQKAGVVIIFSDLIDDPQHIARSLKRLAHKKHDIRLAHLFDPAELNFPYEDTTCFRGMESTADITIESAAIRNAYLDEIKTHVNFIQAACHAAKIEYHQLQTTDPPDLALRKLFQRKRTT